MVVTKHFSNQTKRPKVLLCDDFKNGNTNEEEDIILLQSQSCFQLVP
jgi:hypothetical protein